MGRLGNLPGVYVSEKGHWWLTESKKETSKYNLSHFCKPTCTFSMPISFLPLSGRQTSKGLMTALAEIRIQTMGRLSDLFPFGGTDGSCYYL